MKNDKSKLQRYVSQLDPMQDYLIREFVDNYEDGVMGRRDLLERVFHIVGSTAAAAGVLLALGIKPALADPLASGAAHPPVQQGPSSPFSVPADDPAVTAAAVTFPSGGVTMQAYWARPRAEGRYPAVLICHENRGIGEHYQDVARRYAKNGFAAIVLDLLSYRGGTAAVPENERGGALTGPGLTEQFVGNFKDALALMRQQPFVLPDRIGMTGYCFGGNVTWNVAAREPSLRAAVPYYGVPAFPDELGNVQAAVLGVYGELDARVDASIPNVQQQMAAAGRTFKVNLYPGAAHAFFNDTNPASYVESAATAAWRDTLAWFGAYLRAGLPQTGDGSMDGDSTDDGAVGTTN